MSFALDISFSSRHTSLCLFLSYYVKHSFSYAYIIDTWEIVNEREKENMKFLKEWD